MEHAYETKISPMHHLVNQFMGIFTHNDAETERIPYKLRLTITSVLLISVAAYVSYFAILVIRLAVH